MRNRRRSCEQGGTGREHDRERSGTEPVRLTSESGAHCADERHGEQRHGHQRGGHP